MKDASVNERTIKPIRFRHGLLALTFLAVAMAFCVVGLGTEPQMPLVIGCLLAGGLAIYLGFKWDDVLESMMKGIMDSMEAVRTDENPYVWSPDAWSDSIQWQIARFVLEG